MIAKLQRRKTEQKIPGLGEGNPAQRHPPDASIKNSHQEPEPKFPRCVKKPSEVPHGPGPWAQYPALSNSV